MPPKKSSVSVDELIEVFLDGRVTETIAKALKPDLVKLIGDCLDEKLTELHTRVGVLESGMKKIEDRIDDIERQNTTLGAENIQLKNDVIKSNKVLVEESRNLNEDNVVIRKNLNDFAAYSQRDNLIIYGLQCRSYAEASSGPSMASTQGSPHQNDRPSQAQTATLSLDTSSKYTEQAVIDFFNNVMNVPVSKLDVSVAHRLPKTNLPNQQPYPVIVRFTNRSSVITSTVREKP